MTIRLFVTEVDPAGRPRSLGQGTVCSNAPAAADRDPRDRLGPNKQRLWWSRPINSPKYKPTAKHSAPSNKSQQLTIRRTLARA